MSASTGMYGIKDLSMANRKSPGPLEPIFSPFVVGRNRKYQDTTKFITLMVANFPYGTSKEDLYELFEDYEPIDIIMVVNSPSQNHNYTFAYIVLPDDKRAEAALFELDSTSFNKNELVVCYALERIA